MRRWHDGFEVDRSLDAMGEKYEFVLLGSHSFPAGYRFGYAFLGADHTAPFGHTFSTPQFDSHQIWIIGARFAAITANADTRVVWDLKDNLAEQLYLWCRRVNPGDLDFHCFGINVGSTTLAVTAPIANGEHHYHEVKVKVDPSEGYLEWRIDGRLFVSLENINTALEGTSVADQVQFLSPNIQIDDLYVNDGSGGVNNDFEGEQVIEAILPNADAGPNEWNASSAGDHVDDVDEDVPDDDSTYIECSANDLEEQYAHTALENVNKGISAVMVSARSRLGSASTSRELTLSITDTDGKQESDPEEIPDTDWKFHSLIVPLDASGLPWKKDKLDATTIGIEAVS